MKQLSDTVLKLLNSQSPNYTMKFLLHTKVWDAASGKYSFSGPQNITPFVINSGAIKWKLDNEGYSVWNNAGLSLTINEKADIFEETENLILYGARIDVYCGVSNKGESYYEKIFRGFIMREPSYNPEEKAYIVDLNGELACLSSYSAADLSIKKSDILISSRISSSPSSDDAQYLSFDLSDKAVGEVSNVRVGLLSEGVENAVMLKEVNEYEVSSTNSYKYPARITLLNPLAAGYGLWADYKCWHTDKSIEWIVAKTVEMCGNPQAYIESVNYEGRIDSFFNQPSDADFLQGESEYTENTQTQVTLPSEFIKNATYDWTVIDYTNLPFNLTPCSVGINDGQLNRRGSVSAPCSQAYGTWEAEVTCLWNEPIGQYYFFVSDSPDWRNCNGYYFTHTKFDSFRLFFAFFKLVNGVDQQIGMVWMDRDNQSYTMRYRICRDPNGAIRFMVRVLTPVMGQWIDFGTVCIDNQFTRSTHHIVIMDHYGNNHFYNIKLSPQAATGEGNVAPYGNYYSPVIDGGQGFINWKNFVASDEVNGCASSFYTRSKPEETSTWSDWQQITSASAINETGRYLQLKWLGRSDIGQTKAPKLKYWQAQWEADGVNIAMINTSSMSCLDIVQELARLSGYQIGFDSEGTFFFKKRPALAEPCMKISKRDIISVESVSGGVDKLYNRVSVNFGNYSSVVDEFTLDKARPNLIDKYGVKELGLSSGALLPAQNANIARASAPCIYREVSKIKKRAAVICRFLPQIELGDIIEVDYGAELSGNMMVEGLEFDFNNWTLRLDLCSWES